MTAPNRTLQISEGKEFPLRIVSRTMAMQEQATGIRFAELLGGLAVAGLSALDGAKDNPAAAILAMRQTGIREIGGLLYAALEGGRLAAGAPGPRTTPWTYARALDLIDEVGLERIMEPLALAVRDYTFKISGKPLPEEPDPNGGSRSRTKSPGTGSSKRPRKRK